MKNKKIIILSVLVLITLVVIFFPVDQDNSHLISLGDSVEKVYKTLGEPDAVFDIEGTKEKELFYYEYTSKFTLVSSFPFLKRFTKRITVRIDENGKVSKNEQFNYIK